MKNILIFILTAALIFTISNYTSASTAFVNEGFETGNFCGWETIGDASIQTSAFGSGPTQGSYQALITNAGQMWMDQNPISGEYAVMRSDIDDFLGLNLDIYWHEGSSIKQTFSAETGGVLHFDWNFLTNEIGTISPEGWLEAYPYPDTAFITINENVTVLIDADDGYIATDFPCSLYSPYFYDSSTQFALQTGFAHFSYKLPEKGSYQLGFGIIDLDDYICNSALLIDNIRFVPEPSSLVLFGIALCGIGVIRKNLIHNANKR